MIFLQLRFMNVKDIYNNKFIMSLLHCNLVQINLLNDYSEILANCLNKSLYG